MTGRELFHIVLFNVACVALIVALSILAIHLP